MYIMTRSAGGSIAAGCLGIYCCWGSIVDRRDLLLREGSIVGGFL